MVLGSCTSGGDRLPPGGPPQSGKIVGHLLLAGGVFNVKRPVPGTIAIEGGTAAGGTGGTWQVGVDGAFEVDVLPGAYTVTGRSPMYHVDGQEGLCQARHNVEVVSGGVARANVYCDMK
jgi:hypothetical protein